VREPGFRRGGERGPLPCGGGSRDEPPSTEPPDGGIARAPATRLDTVEVQLGVRLTRLHGERKLTASPMTRYARAAGATLARRSVGLGWRPELAGDLLQAPEAIGCAEIVAETCFAQPAARREAWAIAEVWPVITHGVKLSLGSAEGIEVERARRLGALARELRSPAISEHVALTRAGGREIGHLTALPYTREAIGVLARNVARARRVLPDVPLLLENIAWSLR